MPKFAYYNEFDPKAAAWLRELIADGLIPQGEVDERSIAEVEEADLKGFVQCHFFAGVGGWSYALRLAGWPDDRPVWTGSCPCQPFSAAGQRKGEADERDLWPDMLRLIEAKRPPIIFGEQVASSDVVGSQLEASFLVAVQTGNFARANKLAKQLATSGSFHFTPRWLTRVRSGLAAADYALRWGVLGAHSVLAPHIRQRLFWVANAKCNTGRPGRFGEQSRCCPSTDGTGAPAESGRCSDTGRLANTDRSECGCGPEPVGEYRGTLHATDRSGVVRMADASGERLGGESVRLREQRENTDYPQVAGCGTDGRLGHWSDSKLIHCRDGKTRRIPDETQRGVQLVVDGLPAVVDGSGPTSRLPLSGEKIDGLVMLLRGAGNAIVPQVAAAFIQAYLEAKEPK